MPSICQVLKHLCLAHGEVAARLAPQTSNRAPRNMKNDNHDTYESGSCGCGAGADSEGNLHLTKLCGLCQGTSTGTSAATCSCRKQTSQMAHCQGTGPRQGSVGFCWAGRRVGAILDTKLMSTDWVAQMQGAGLRAAAAAAGKKRPFGRMRVIEGS